MIHYFFKYFWFSLLKFVANSLIHVYWCEVLITYKSFSIGMRVILASQNKLGITIYFNFLKSLYQIGIISSLNVWQNSPMKLLIFGFDDFSSLILNYKFSVFHRYSASAIYIYIWLLTSFTLESSDIYYIFPFFAIMWLVFHSSILISAIEF